MQKEILVIDWWKSMIKQMERRFTMVAISIISLVLLLLIIFVNIISMSGNVQRADNALLKMTEIQVEGDIREPKDPRDIGKDFNRSFIVDMDDELNLISSNAYERNILDDDIAYKMAIVASEKSKTTGFVEDFRYLKIEQNDQIKVIFLDYSFERQSEINFIYVSIGVFFVAIILVVVLVKILLKPVMKPIKESFAKQKQFITDASHELRTPLTVISTDMEIIEMENGSSDWITSVNHQVKRLNTLTKELVVLSRMNEMDSRFDMAQVNMSDIINDVAMGFEPAVEAKGKKLILNIEDDIKVNGHYDGLERVMSILFSNALKYSDDHGTIRVDLLKKGKKISLSVYNTLDDIEVGHHPELFERFYRSDASRNSETGGFGIGLAVANSIIEEHKGKIEAKSMDAKSIEFIITLKV